MFAERGNANRNNRQPIVEILPEESLLHSFFKVSVGGNQDPHIDGAGLRGPNSQHLAIDQDAKQFGLSGCRHFAGFVQKKGSAMRGLKQTLAGSICSSKGSSFMPKEFALQESFSESRTVDCNQGLLGPAAVPMNCPGDEFLARSSFPNNQVQLRPWGQRGRSARVLP